MKRDELERHRITADYLKYRIEKEGETNRRESLSQVQTLIEELERQLTYFKKL